MYLQTVCICFNTSWKMMFKKLQIPKIIAVKDCWSGREVLPRPWPHIWKRKYSPLFMWGGKHEVTRVVATKLLNWPKTGRLQVTPDTSSQLGRVSRVSVQNLGLCLLCWIPTLLALLLAGLPRLSPNKMLNNNCTWIFVRLCHTLAFCVSQWKKFHNLRSLLSCSFFPCVCTVPI